MSDDILKNGYLLLNEVCVHPDSFSGKGYNELLSLFLKGLPLSELRSLLRHRNERVIAGALFITEELGAKAGSLLDDVIILAHHSNPRIRGSAYGAIGRCISDGPADAFIHIVLGINDTDAVCRRVSMIWMIRAPDEWLSVANRLLGSSQSNAGVIEGLNMLLGESARDGRTVKSWVLSESAFIRKIGVIASGRLADEDIIPLELAAQSQDIEIRECAIGYLNLIRRPRKWCINRRQK